LTKQAPWELFRLPALLELQGVQPAVDPACGQQFPVGSHLAHLPLVHHDDPVGGQDRQRPHPPLPHVRRQSLAPFPGEPFLQLKERSENDGTVRT